MPFTARGSVVGCDQTRDMQLSALGWDEVWAGEFGRMADRAAVEQPARVSLEHNHVYRVLTEAGEHLAELAGKVKYEAAGRHEMPAVGDWVILRAPTGVGGRPQIRAVLPRRSVFSRMAAGRETGEQVVAANIDTVFLVSGLDRDFNPRRIERYLVLARRSGAQPVIVLNKADLCRDLPAALAAVLAVAPEVPVHAVRAVGDVPDVSALRAYLGAGRTVALLGSSGVGKSSIINALAGREMVRTGDVRERDGRGRHTSVHRQLVVLEDGGLVIDTPGMRELQLWDATDTLEQSFPEIDARAADCRFRDCRHETEPGCAVKVAVSDGTIDASRYESYVKLQHEREAAEVRLDERALIEQKRQSKLLGKAVKALQRDRGR